MYSRRLYVSLLGVAVGALQLTAGFGTERKAVLAYAVTVGLGIVVFYQGERRVAAGPVFVNAGAAVLLGTVASFLFSGGLVMYFLGAPWDLALWQIGILLWDSLVGIAVVFVSTFFVVAFGASIH